ncbi:MAG: BtrH N-terminal domain-containing protein [Jatrophihabitantaceae bacterium]
MTVTSAPAQPQLDEAQLGTAQRELAQASRRPSTWYRDAVSCLHATIATVLAQHGHDPLEVLGTGWSFYHRPDDLPFEEFYWPVPDEDNLGHCLAPHHQLDISWHACSAPDRALSELAELLRQGLLPIAAVDNYHLPFRPAYHDVHAAHLIVVYGVDEYRDLVLVADPAPPGFNGPLANEAFLAATSSSNPADEQDAFFSETEIAGRFLVVRPDARLSALSPAEFGKALQANLDRFHDPAGAQQWSGLAGLRRYLDAIERAATIGDCQQVRRIYPFGWGVQAAAAVHGELLRTRGGQWRVPELIEAGRAVERVAHLWTGIRVSAAHNWHQPDQLGDSFARRGHQLLAAYHRALELTAGAIDKLS